MAELLEIDGVSLRGQGFGAATRTGRYGIPARRGENLVLPGSSGASFVANKPFEVGSGALALWAIGATTDGAGKISIPASFNLQRQAFENNVASLSRLFTRPHRLSTIRAAQPDGSIRRALVEWKEWSEPEVQAGGTRAEWNITYEIPSVWWEDETATTQTSAVGAALPKTFDLTSFTGMTGILEDAVLTVQGSITNPRITDLETGMWVQYTGVVAAGSSWVVDVGAFTSKVGGTAVLANTTHKGSYKFLPIANCYGSSNTPRLQLTGSSGGTATSLSITAKRKWVNG